MSCVLRPFENSMRIGMRKLWMWVVVLSVAPICFAQEAGSMWMYVGTYSGKNSDGIYVMRLDTATGKLSEPKLAVKAAHASFVAIHPNKKSLYAVNEVSDSRGMK